MHEGDKGDRIHGDLVTLQGGEDESEPSFFPLCRGAWTTKQSPRRMSIGTSGSRSVAGSV